MTDVHALALDFGGTLARPGPSPEGHMVANALRELAGAAIPQEFAETFDTVTRWLRQADQESNGQTPLAEQLCKAAEECGAALPDLDAAVEAVFTAVPDAEIDPDAARTLRNLHASGLVCVLACDTQRPEAVRRRTLGAAGILDCFDALVLSSTIGVRKPHPAFYAAVVEAAGHPASEIMFVGDTPAKDAVAPVAYGMRSVLIADDRPVGLEPSIGVLRHISELPAYLEALHAR
ncbi:HAD family hydrolase [Microbispora sp. NBC_01189]|uniref:HAD family hydrolase n=1 Tax=Microbispora sp. NBC_01189 TaxID=2903583 RepID=UPI002E1213B1|nr:HAD family hydrolase [Microbispora sp. NBC_01189]